MRDERLELDIALIGALTKWLEQRDSSPHIRKKVGELYKTMTGLECPKLIHNPT